VESLDSYLPIHAYQVWIAAAIVLGVAETLTGGFFVIIFGLGCLVGALAAYLGAGLNVQLGSAILSSLAIFALSRTLFRDYLVKKGSPVRTNAAAIVGQEGEVIESIGIGAARGLVRIGGEVWTALSPTPIDAGERVQVDSIDGLKLHVSRISNHRARRDEAGGMR